ncbi:MAG TPA: 4Fe-4S binding protein [Clostridia bacterium]|nr:4Fe-4S binding protein [Clostridia bacterium]
MTTRYFHSVTLDKEKCRGCTNCIKQCPNEAIRVREGKARILEERCIDCGECIRICPNHAKLAVTDTLEKLSEFKYSIALPAPSIYGQFEPGVSIEEVLRAFIDIGFDDVFEVALAAEAVTYATRRFLENYRGSRPLISSACPAVVRFIQIHFHSLLDHIVPIDTPMEVAGAMAKAWAEQALGLKKEEVGVFFISPCPAKVTAIKQPVMKEKSNVDGAISISLLYGLLSKRVSTQMKTKGVGCSTHLAGKKETEEESHGKEGHHREGWVDLVRPLRGDNPFLSTGRGIGWGRAGGEAQALGGWSILTVDGIHNVRGVLEQVERKKLLGIDFIEAQACTGGCVGGCLTVQNPFVARVRLRVLAEQHWNKRPALDEDCLDNLIAAGAFTTKKVEPRPVMALDEDVARAIAKMDILEKTVKELPGLDCGACGSPNCRTLAEDIVRGIALETDCTFKLRERVKALAEEMADLAGKIPPAMGLEKTGGESSEGK